MSEAIRSEARRSAMMYGMMEHTHTHTLSLSLSAGPRVRSKTLGSTLVPLECLEKHSQALWGLERVSGSTQKQEKKGQRGKREKENIEGKKRRRRRGGGRKEEEGQALPEGAPPAVNTCACWGAPGPAQALCLRSLHSL